MKRSIQRKINKTGKMVCEICKKSEILVEHHIEGRKINNYNAWYNRANICSNCHNNIHHGLIIIERWVQTTVGKELIWHYKEDQSFTKMDSSCYQMNK